MARRTPITLKKVQYMANNLNFEVIKSEHSSSVLLRAKFEYEDGYIPSSLVYLSLREAFIWLTGYNTAKYEDTI